MKIITPDDLSQFSSDEPPKGPNGKPKKRFVVKEEMTTGEVAGPFFQKNIYIEGELFDWAIDEESYKWAQKQSPEVLMAAQKDIVKHFLNSLSEIVGRRVTLQDLQEATKTGWI